MNYAKDFILELNNQTYKFSVKEDRTLLFLSFEPTVSLLPVVYKAKFTEKEIKETVPYFESFSTLNDIAFHISSLIENSKANLTINENLKEAKFIIHSSVETKKEFCISIPLCEMNKDELISVLYSTILKMSNQISVLSTKIQRLESEEASHTQIKETNKKIENISIKLNRINNVNINPNSDELYLTRVKATLSNDILLNSKEEIELIRQFINPLNNADINLSLLYKATIDSSSSKSFHEKCDDHSPTLTLIKTTQGIRFGGYTYQTWNADDGNCKSDEYAFLFNLDYRKKYTIKDKETCAIYCHSHYGPSFGCGFDICIPDKFLNENINGTYSKFPCSFGAGASKNELTMRNFNFAVSELEVYQVTFTDNL